MSIAAANLFTRTIYKELLKPDATPAQETRVARLASLLMKVGALGFALELNKTFSINLQLLGGIWILQTFPAIVISLYTRWFHRAALIIGWAVAMLYGTVQAYRTPGGGQAHFGASAAPVFGHVTYIAIPPSILNLAVSAVLTVVFRLSGLQDGYDATKPSDYIADPEPARARQPHRPRRRAPVMPPAGPRAPRPGGTGPRPSLPAHPSLPARPSAGLGRPGAGRSRNPSLSSRPRPSLFPREGSGPGPAAEPDSFPTPWTGFSAWADGATTQPLAPQPPAPPAPRPADPAARRTRRPARCHPNPNQPAGSLSKPVSAPRREGRAGYTVSFCRPGLRHFGQMGLVCYQLRACRDGNTSNVAASVAIGAQVSRRLPI